MKAPALPPRVIVLVGLPGAGKSTVGALVAERLGFRFVDLDHAIVARAGQSIEAIFAAEGEEGFRARERAETRSLAAPARAPGGHAGDPALVIAPGGGWIEDHSNREALGDRVLTVYLRVSVPVALARLAQSGGVRPLLGGPDPAFRLEELRQRREGLYLQADHTISVDSLTPLEVALSIVGIAMGSTRD
jgi:shikimate kinase